MAVTAHWVEETTIATPTGPKSELKLRADLIGFRRVSGRHTGDHLAQTFLEITDRLGITYKVRLPLTLVYFYLLFFRSDGLLSTTHQTTTHF